MGMVERHSNLLALVLEDVDIVHVVARPQLQVAICPHVYQQSHSLERELSQRQLVFGRVDDNLATAGARGPDGPAVTPVGTEGGKSVLKHNDFERVERHFGGAAGTSRAERAEFRRKKSAVVALGRISDPLTPKRVEAELRHRQSTGDRKRSGSAHPEARSEPWSAELDPRAWPLR
jgi:hypothetical protein